jgi:hypothetical protein
MTTGILKLFFFSTQIFTDVAVLTGTGVNSSANEYLKLLNRKSHNGNLFLKVIPGSILHLKELSNANYNKKLRC